MCKMMLNESLKGIELYGMDLKAVKEELKENGFRWNRTKSCWYAKQTSERMELAEKLSNGVVENMKTVKENKIHIDKEIDLFELTRIDNITVNSDITYCTDIAKEVRSVLRKRFPFVKFSITVSKFAGGSEIYASVKSSIFEEDSVYLKVVCKYVDSLINTYNKSKFCYYFDCKVDYDYTVVENNKFNVEDIKTLFDTKKAEYDKKEEERKYNEYLEQKAQWEKEESEAKKQQVIREQQKQEIENNVKVVDIAENEQYYIKNTLFAKMNKNNTITEYRKEIENSDYYLQDVKVTKEIHFSNKKYLDNFSNMLLSDFSFLSETGGSFTEDNRINSMEDYNQMSDNERKSVKWLNYAVAIYLDNKLMFVIDAQGYSYSRYVGLIDSNTETTKAYDFIQLVDNTEIENRSKEANTIVNIVNSVIVENNMQTVKDITVDNKDSIRKQVVNKIKDSSIHLNNNIVQQIKENDILIKNYLYYTVLKENDTITEQLNYLQNNINKNDVLTIIQPSMIAGASISYLIFDSIDLENNKVIGSIQGKKGLYSANVNKDMLIYVNTIIPATVLWEKNGNSTRTTFGSYDNKALDTIIDYCRAKEEYPILNTYKPVF